MQIHLIGLVGFMEYVLHSPILKVPLEDVLVQLIYLMYVPIKGGQKMNVWKVSCEKQDTILAILLVGQMVVQQDGEEFRD